LNEGRAVHLPSLRKEGEKKHLEEKGRFRPGRYVGVKLGDQREKARTYDATLVGESGITTRSALDVNSPLPLLTRESGKKGQHRKEKMRPIILVVV